MGEFVKLISSNNIIEVDQILFALKNEGIEGIVKGRKALEVGNVELTGIEGATILVPGSHITEAKLVLTSMGIDSLEKENHDYTFTKVWIGFGILLFMVIIAMIIIALME